LIGPKNSVRENTIDAESALFGSGRGDKTVVETYMGNTDLIPE
jgi:hypothetical protein